MADVAAVAPEEEEPAVRVLEIPVQNSDEVVAVPLDELPDDAEEVEALVDVLKAEKAELRLWLDFAMEYYRQARRRPPARRALARGIFVAAAVAAEPRCVWRS